MHFQLVQEPILLMPKEKGTRLDGMSIAKDGQMLKIQIPEAQQCMKSPSLRHKKSYFDCDLLKHMGLTKARLEKHDAFFFWQLFSPICEPS
jgi:hypothetical protein